MRILNILSGLAVLFTTLAFAHLLHQYYTNAGEAAHSPPFMAGMAIGIDSPAWLQQRLVRSYHWPAFFAARVVESHFAALNKTNTMFPGTQIQMRFTVAQP
jgi:hypothetical protein